MDSENEEPRYNKKTGVPMLRCKGDWGDVSKRMIVALDGIGVTGIKADKFKLPDDPKEHAEWNKINNAARFFLIGQLAPSVLDLVNYELSAQEIWNTLHNLYQGNNAVNKKKASCWKNSGMPSVTALQISNRSWLE